ncbi:MerR HTH family regulatory protein [Seinonella peptonophila]|uniref:MerR HTH family regulatory protein n=1 Tax=Seinonella peptonophila TaxID=112248 RepID=A0A1M4WKQ0_9BACL|nr:MerR family transcriptional regulator [Seinonella peptonophila]SHE81774.1 MerR HTH family regulatory protein [Seinonella peptonophila]
MSTEQVVLYSTGDAAKQLQVSTRTIRTWIDQFFEYIRPEYNERGHYIIDPDCLERLREVQRRLQEPKKKIKQVREELYHEKFEQISDIAQSTEERMAASTKISYIETEKTLHHVISVIEGVGNMMEDLAERMDHLEDHLYAIYESVEKIDQNLHSLAYDTIPATEMRQQLEEIRKKNDQIKLELRNVNFTQRLAVHQEKGQMSSQKNETNFVPRRQKKRRFFNLF